MAKRVIFIDHMLGYSPLSQDFENLAGDEESRERQATEIKGEIVALCTRHGGKLTKEKRETDVYEDDETGTEIEYFFSHVVEIEYPSDDLAERATDEINELYSLWGVMVINYESTERD